MCYLFLHSFFFLIAKWHSIEWKIPHFIYPFIGRGMLGLFPLGTILHRTVLLLCTVVYMFSCGHVLSILSGMYLEVELLGHMVPLCLSPFEDLPYCFPKQPHRFILDHVYMRPRIYEATYI